MTELFDFNLIKWEIPAISIGTTLAPDFSGDGYIAGESPGLVTIDGSPASVELELRDRETRELVKVTQSELDGTYRFDNLNIYREYDIIARDPSRTYKDIVAPAIRPKVDYVYIVSKWKHYHLLTVDFQTVVNGGTPPYTVESSTDRIEATIDDNLLSVHSDILGARTRFTLTITDSNGETLVLSGTVDPIVNPFQPIYAGGVANVRFAGDATMWRIFISDAFHNNTAICEIEMYDSIESTTNLCVGGLATSDISYDSTWTPEKAFDGIKTGDQGWSAVGSLPHWIAYEFPEAVDVIKIQLTHRSNNNQYMPRVFVVQKSNNGIDWTDVWSITDTTPWSYNETREYTNPDA